MQTVEFDANLHLPKIGKIKTKRQFRDLLNGPFGDGVEFHVAEHSGPKRLTVAQLRNMNYTLHVQHPRWKAAVTVTRDSVIVV